jgi:hypothetical protein
MEIIITTSHGNCLHITLFLIIYADIYLEINNGTKICIAWRLHQHQIEAKKTQRIDVVIMLSITSTVIMLSSDPLILSAHVVLTGTFS